MLMRFRGGGVGHTSTRTATDRFLKDRDRLDRDNGPTQGGDDPDEIEDGFDGNDIDEAVDEEAEVGDGDDNNLRDSNGGDEESGTRDVDDEGSNGDEEEDYGYRHLVDEDDNEEDSDDEPLDVGDDALGPEDGEGYDDEVNLLGFAAF
jgi:hypothetical protein